MKKDGITRRDFVKLGAALGVVAVSENAFGMLKYLEPVKVDNPLAGYPDRDWEHVYRDMFNYESTFVFTCAPNDTHNCLLRAYVKNGTVVRISPTYGYGKATDLSGNRASHRWDPRCCQKGLTLARRFYGDRRIKGAMVRKGFKAWSDAGFPRDTKTGSVPNKYLNRGKDGWVRMGWDEAYELSARAMLNIAETYSGQKGMKFLKAQGYDPAMVEEAHEAGTRTFKLRGGMALLGQTRIWGLYRFSNMLALLDDHIRKTGAEKSLGGRGLDSYSWHTDLPPGHPMVTGQQTVDFDLFAVENSRLAILWGMNWISTKMPDSHWLCEARQKGTKVCVIATEYNSSSTKADEVLIVRPGTDSALALGMAKIIIDEGLYNEDFIKNNTDLPLLVRMDTLELLRPAEFIAGYKNAELTNHAKVLHDGEKLPAAALHDRQYISDKLREEWGDFTIWNNKSGQAEAVTRNNTGRLSEILSMEMALTGEFKIKLIDGATVRVRPVFDLINEYLKEFDLEKTSQITWASKDAIAGIARQIAANPEKTLLIGGMGVNQFFNNDLFGRSLLLLASLTRNIGFIGGNAGSYSGNYRTSLFNGIPQYMNEDPFNIEADPGKPARTKGYFKAESAHYFNYGDRPLRLGNTLFTGKSHMPTPTKVMWGNNSNSLIGNTKWLYDVIVNTLPKLELIIFNDWWWSNTCEYSDIVFGVDSWVEFKQPDMCAAVSNPFLTVFPRTPLPRLFETRSDIETFAGVAEKMAELTGDKRFSDYWKFVKEDRIDVYLQRIMDASSAVKGYDFLDVEAKAKEGIPSLMMNRTYPRNVGWEQSKESRPWYTKTGRLEFYRPEIEFLDSGENIPVYREPVDATFYIPNVIVGSKHEFLRPKSMEQLGIRPDDKSIEVRQVRNIILPWSEVEKTTHPLMKDKDFRFILYTPKYRHGAHTTPVDTDLMAVYFGPFGDMYRRDKRMPFVGEAYVDINPMDARSLGIEDGDYVWIDGDPQDRPFRGWKKRSNDFMVARLLVRARYYNQTPRGCMRIWHNMYGASHGSVKGQRSRKDGLAKNPETGYQSMYRSGSQQSTTRAWLKPTLMTDSLVRKDGFGQSIGKGFYPDIHCATGAPRESLVKISKAENGGIDGRKLWRPAELGFRPTYENKALKSYLSGMFITRRGYHG